MSKPIEKGSFVVSERHPEHGVGRVLAVGPLSTRVIFMRGGLRVFRAGTADALLRNATPQPQDVEALAALEVQHTSGALMAATRAPAPPAAKKPRKKKAAAVT